MPLAVRRIVSRFGMPPATAIIVAEAAGFNMGGGAR